MLSSSVEKCGAKAGQPAPRYSLNTVDLQNPNGIAIVNGAEPHVGITSNPESLIVIEHFFEFLLQNDGSDMGSHYSAILCLGAR